MANDKELKVRITGDSTQLGSESRKAVGSLNEVKAAAQGMLSSFTGGLIGGGIAGAVSAAVNLIAGQIREARQLLRDARSADLDPKFVSGARFFARTINAPENTIESAIQNARQARADAGAGDLDALENFRRLGISMAEIKDLAPDELFYRIADAFKKIGLGKQELAGAAGVLGRAQAQALVPYFAGGDPNKELRNGDEVVRGERLDFRKYLTGDFASKFLQNSDYADRMQVVLAGQRYKRDIEPITMVGIGDEEKAARITKEAQDSVLATLRSQRTIEEQITEITQRRAELWKKMDSESNSVKKAKLLQEDADLFAKQAALKNEADKVARPAGLPLQSFTPPADEFAQRGIFIGGQQQVPSILQTQVLKLDQIIRIAEQQLRENAKYWE
ncbi:MAG: hypothetical protein JNL10_04835 [Verrucomicrobiales bacterium]|nr:hypothetical protein [Verrucomicrobiales bacterium]